MTRALFLVEVDLDPTPGAFHERESARTFIDRTLYERFPQYHPSVRTVLAITSQEDLNAHNQLSETPNDRCGVHPEYRAGFCPACT